MPNRSAQGHAPYQKYMNKYSKNELNCLVSPGVFDKTNEHEWGAPYFAQPKEKRINRNYLVTLEI